MGRIDEALRRVNETGGTPGPEPAVSVFTPAWSVNSHEAPRAKASTGSSERPPFFENAAPRQKSLGLSSEWRERLATEDNANRTLVEQFRRLAGLLHQARQASGLSTVMVTSASQGDGKTLSAVNLALVLAESYRYNVLLVDADLRRPSIPNVVDVGEGAGLSESLQATVDQKLALVRVTSRLSVLPAGKPIANSIEALTSPRMARILEEATALYDWVILDAPPVGPTADARLLTSLVSGTLFVVHAGKTQCPDVQQAVDILGRDQILGIILNGMTDMKSPDYYAYGHPGTAARS